MRRSEEVAVTSGLEGLGPRVRRAAGELSGAQNKSKIGKLFWVVSRPGPQISVFQYLQNKVEHLWVLSLGLSPLHH